ncbi:hypothetical protein PB1_14224 [Bacillus methanolicus PB1]|uniref:Uncharacterized protein n=1 Tax=Bacillus methanolicus PB1 TaxID=997296 RepID=I3DWV0_BACMT|nr:hypothetical protein [Bacillus methanolicus]EIJ78721.1 hypothetical protein PB1_14224 [Bacillus methanolicus PB1]
MLDYIKRFLIAGIIAFFVSLLFLGGKLAHADMMEDGALTSHWL